ncbi:hypothetical protein Pint_22988 [Pistacia integerrima]|uniref:Uncharacterized protein n=1 Tax=Pistacia integerrima TaxID=434235 RepID=A0ACC0YM49_9ROSI|nr:hypothetical protein Pint_22988 [Pistacia integerrima]
MQRPFIHPLHHSHSQYHSRQWPSLILVGWSSPLSHIIGTGASARHLLNSDSWSSYYLSKLIFS